MASTFRREVLEAQVFGHKPPEVQGLSPLMAGKYAHLIEVLDSQPEPTKLKRMIRRVRYLWRRYVYGEW